MAAVLYIKFYAIVDYKIHPGAEEYKTTERKLWFVDNELAGYQKTVRNFTEVRNAGHITLTDQPKRISSLVHKFIYDLF
uniref:Uncharacterized protein n=1 Tax=Rhodnius prolixus TaxID=13249 RepID=T1IBR2_RHOPR